MSLEETPFTSRLGCSSWPKSFEPLQDAKSRAILKIENLNVSRVELSEFAAIKEDQELSNFQSKLRGSH